MACAFGMEACNPDCFDLVEWVPFDTYTESVYKAEVDQLYKMI